MIDCHVLISKDDNRKWFHDCLWSLRNENVNLHISPAIEGDTAMARTKAFLKGNSPYVSFVDADDMVFPKIYDEMLEIMEANKDVVCVYTDQLLISSDGVPIQMGWSSDIGSYKGIKEIEIHNIGGRYMHQLYLIRRDALLKCLPLKTKRMPEPTLTYELNKLGKIQHLNKVGYFWRIHENNTFMKYTDSEFKEALGMRKA